MVFNATDTAISLDSSSGNYLRIQGVTFTQQSSSKLTVDEFFNRSLSFGNMPPTFFQVGFSKKSVKNLL